MTRIASSIGVWEAIVESGRLAKARTDLRSIKETFALLTSFLAASKKEVVLRMRFFSLLLVPYANDSGVNV